MTTEGEKTESDNSGEKEKIATLEAEIHRLRAELERTKSPDVMIRTLAEALGATGPDPKTTRTITQVETALAGLISQFTEEGGRWTHNLERWKDELLEKPNTGEGDSREALLKIIARELKPEKEREKQKGPTLLARTILHDLWKKGNGTLDPRHLDIAEPIFKAAGLEPLIPKTGSRFRATEQTIVERERNPAFTGCVIRVADPGCKINGEIEDKAKVITGL